MNGKTITGLAFVAFLGGSLSLQAQGTSSAASGGSMGETGQSSMAAGAQSKQGADAGAAAVPDPEIAFQNWLTEFRSRAIAQGITETVLDQALTGLHYDASIISRDRNQSEYTRQIWDYLDRAVSADRIANGKAALQKHGDLLRQIEAQYGVEAEVVAAVWGLETAYGTYRGTLPVISSLATLAFDARRGAYFEKELIHALKILQEGHVAPEEFVGSWAGASGHTQFMPSSFWRSAVDWTGDGRRNLWGEDPADALASAASYLAKSGWQKGLPWGVEVTLPANFPWEQSGERIRKSLAEWRALGVEAFGGGIAAPNLAEETEASVLLPAGHQGAAFLIFRNFQVIETYNTADAYVIAIGSLSDQLAGRPAIRGSWPREDVALSGADKLELQQLLLDRGFDPKGVDGIMGPNTIQAIRDYQASAGLVPDGYASQRLIERLRSEAGQASAPPAPEAAVVPASPESAASPAVPGASTGTAPPEAAPSAPAARRPATPGWTPRPPGRNSGE